jgi:hypothetical protein
VTFFLRRSFNKLSCGSRGKSPEKFFGIKTICSAEVKMAKMTKSKILCLIAAFACVQLSLAAPIAESHQPNDVVDEIIMKLKQLKQQSEGKICGNS